MACAEIIVRRWFWTSKDVYWGAIVFFQIRRSWKSWGSHIFFCEKYWVSTWNKQDIIGWLQYSTEFVFNDNPHANYQRYALVMGVALLVYDNTAVPRGSYNFWLSNTGSQNIAEVPLEIYEPLFQSMVTALFIYLYGFLINQILRNIKWFQRNLI